ncbi:hypothetical protein PIB30_018823 [Stylosanthes scabra]|uniref:Uncharacterized protein n=1 Tax=Stylosanthes scabra TaxID=79078 RepID=A0ABU6TA12_9FABA|nr:hypothetical protein [Stylosanthes scabra]
MAVVVDGLVNIRVESCFPTNRIGRRASPPLTHPPQEVEWWITQPVRSMPPLKSSASEEQLFPYCQLSLLGDVCELAHQGVGYQAGAVRVLVECLPTESEHTGRNLIESEGGNAPP